MKRWFAFILLVILISFGMATTLQARDMKGYFGMGTDGILEPNTLRGVGFTYYFHRYFGVQLLGATAIRHIQTDETDGTESSETHKEWLASVRGFVPFILTEHVNISGLLGFNIRGWSRDIPHESEDPSYLTFSMDLGVRPEWFINEHFSIHTQIGMSMRFITEGEATAIDGKPKDSSSGVEFRLGGLTDLSAQLGFTFYL